MRRRSGSWPGSLPNIDIILEATGIGPLAFDAMDLLGNNGVLVWLSIIGGDDRSPLPYSSILRGHVLGNKVTVGSVNSAHEDFTLGVADLGTFELLWPGLAETMITHRLHLDRSGGGWHRARHPRQHQDGDRLCVKLGRQRGLREAPQ